jgi:polar amino acid transport system ATP-binding protein
MISIRNLGKSYGKHQVLKDVSVDIGDREVVAIIGPSGCGKSTLIRCMNLLEKPDCGQILIGGQEITRAGVDIDAVRSKLGMVFQQFNLFSHLNVIENIIVAPMNVLKKKRPQALREAMEYLELVGIANRAFHMPSQLSGGQKQRVAIARCLAMHPEVILFDEPTSALDPTMVDEVLTVIRKLVNNGMSCVIVTHEMAFAKNVATQVWYLDEQGIYEKGSQKEIFENPRREKTRIFIEKLKIYTGEFLASEMDPYEVLRQVMEYCNKYGMTRQQRDTIRLICEEYLSNLIKMPGRDARVTVIVRYNEKDQTRELEFRDTYPEANHLEGEDFDEISARLIQGYAASLEYRYLDGVNAVRIQVK